MNYTSFCGYEISQFTLGTVQLGLNYGISNKSGIPDKTEVHDMLDFAGAMGITAFDTAREYGKSEQVLGSYFAGGATDIPFVSKFKIKPTLLSDKEAVWKEVKESIEQSLGALKIPILPIALLHKGTESIERVMDILPEIIQRLKEEELVVAGGISAYYPNDVPALFGRPEIEAIQLPLNVFDQRLLNTGTLDRLAAEGKLVFVRSIFLQGLFFLSPNALPGKLAMAQKHLVALNEMAEESGLSVTQIAFSYVRDLPGVNSLVIGANNTDQIRQNMELLNGPPLPPDLRKRLSLTFSEMEDFVVTPGMWHA